VASLSSFVPNGVEAEDLAGLPVFIAHGQDDPIIPVEAGRRARDIFDAAGAEVRYGEYETGHKMSTAGLNDLKEWLADLLKK
jgi:phospholipase/carboxylesterase